MNVSKRAWDITLSLLALAAIVVFLVVVIGVSVYFTVVKLTKRIVGRDVA